MATDAEATLMMMKSHSQMNDNNLFAIVEELTRTAQAAQEMNGIYREFIQSQALKIQILEMDLKLFQAEKDLGADELQRVVNRIQSKHDGETSESRRKFFSGVLALIERARHGTQGTENRVCGKLQTDGRESVQRPKHRN